MLSGVERSLYEHHHTELLRWFRKQSTPCGWALCWFSVVSLQHRVTFFPGAEWHTGILLPGRAQLSHVPSQISSVCTKRKPPPHRHPAVFFLWTARQELLCSDPGQESSRAVGISWRSTAPIILNTSVLGFPSCASFLKNILKSMQDQELWIQPQDVSKWVFLASLILSWVHFPWCEIRALLPCFKTDAVDGLWNVKWDCVILPTL